MANEIRLRNNNISGTITDNPLSIGATTINSAGFADLPVVGATNHMLLILDPQEVGGTAEIVRVTAHTAAATSVTVQRGQESSSARSHVFNTTWMHGPVASDFNSTPSPLPICVVRRTAAQTFTTAVAATIVWDTEDVDTDNMNSGSGTFTVTTPGIYSISAGGIWAGNVTGYRHMDLISSGGVILGGITVPGINDGNTMTWTRVIRAAAGDTFTMRALQNSGGNLNLGGDGHQRTFASFTWLAI